MTVYGLVGDQLSTEENRDVVAEMITSAEERVEVKRLTIRARA